MLALLALGAAALTPTTPRPNEALSRRLGLAPRALKEGGDGPPVMDRGLTVVLDPEAEKPKMYRCMLHNSPGMDGAVVSQIIRSFFNKSSAQAWDLMLAAHNTGRSVLGVYTKEIAETRVARAMEASRAEMQARHGMNGDLSLTVEAE
jgi:ATP-dependent Clp protease adaptor protein ClpS